MLKLSLRSRRFQKLTRRERIGGSAKNKEHAWGEQIEYFCSPQACSLARTLFRSLVRSLPGKGKESAARRLVKAGIPFLYRKYLVVDKK